MLVKKRELCLKVAYMLGVRDDLLRDWNDIENYDELLAALRADKSATIIRCLCRLRTELMKHFTQTHKLMMYSMLNLSSIEWFNTHDEVKYLRSVGLDIQKANYSVSKYMRDFSLLINDRINACEHLFPKDWQRFDLIKKLFVIPKCHREDVMIEKYEAYNGDRSVYPYQMFVANRPDDDENLLYDDERFLRILILNNGEEYRPNQNSNDATDETKYRLKNFIENAGKVSIVVDCENSDPYKLVSILRGLETKVHDHITKIVLFDDYNCSLAWDIIHDFISLPIEHIMLERITAHKSFLDVRLAANVCKQHYKEDIDSFIILSSDSDYWGLVEELTSASFLLMYENGQTAHRFKEALQEHGHYIVCLDDFCSGNVEDFQNTVLFTALADMLDEDPDVDLRQMIDIAYDKARIEATPMEKQRFYDRRVKKAKFSLDKDGRVKFD